MRLVAILAACVLVAVPAASGSGADSAQPRPIVTARELLNHSIGLENDALDAKDLKGLRALVREASENLETAIHELERATGSVSVERALKAAQTALERDEAALKSQPSLKIRKGFVEAALRQKRHAAAETVGAGVKVRVTARFIPALSKTRYTAELDDEKPGLLITYRWKLDPPEDDPTCKKLRRGTPHPNEAEWLHNAKDGCSHATTQHEGTVSVTVKVGKKWICEADYFGTETTPARGHDLEFCRLR